MRYVLLILLTINVWASETIRIGLIPWNTPEQMIRDYTPTKKLLEEKLGVPVELKVASNYAEILKRFKSRAVNMMLLGGNQFAKEYGSGEEFVYLATVKTDINGKAVDHYKSLIISRKDSKIKNLADMKGKSFAFTDRDSGSGFVIPSLVFDMAGIRPERHFSKVYFLKKHPKVYAAIANGSVDAGAVSNELWEESVKKYGSVFRIVMESPDLPLDAMVISSDMDEKQVQQIKTILIHAEEDSAFSHSKSAVKGYSSRGSDYYDTYREAQKLSF